MEPFMQSFSHLQHVHACVQMIQLANFIPIWSILMAMRDWLSIFHKEKGFTLTLNKQILKQGDYEKVGQGSQKLVFKIKDKNLCFFIPNKWRSEQEWEELITAEKERLDEILGLGIRAQKFEIAALTITSATGKTFIINALVTQDLQSLCEQEAVVIHNPKGAPIRVLGKRPPLYAQQERFKDKTFIQKMLAKIINEYALAFTFKLPIHPLNTDIDDSEHYCFEIPKDANEPPVACYMFWDVANDFAGVNIPSVPTLDELKKGFDDFRRSIDSLANGVACAIDEIASEEIENARKDGQSYDSVMYPFHKHIEACIKEGLNDDEFLNKALVNARQAACKFLKETIQKPGIRTGLGKTNEFFMLFIKSAISSGDVALVTEIMSLDSKPSNLTAENAEELTSFAKKYNNQPVIECVLKQLFLHKYQDKLTADKGAFCGIYGFFARSYIKDSMSLKEMVEHAQGFSKEGSGARSRTLMKEMGWLNADNTISGDLSLLNMK